ncbi:hypothetical protein GYA49_05910 [Candidatus Beckwithbacteria bacterium]|nr:hypothetical protein [Candidatus Beckwithbacteria bacterium]
MKPAPKRQASKMQSLGDLLQNHDLDNSGKYISREFQDYGYRLALELDDLKRVSMYIKFAKTMPRSLLEQARSFVTDATNVKSKSRLFMWKLKQIKSKEKKI